MTTEQLQQTPASPHRSVDAHGRVIPRTEEEQRQHVERALRALDALDTMGDEEEQRTTFEALGRAIDEEPLSTRSVRGQGNRREICGF
jgi:hypothetical protein